MGYFNLYGQYVQDDSELYHHGILGMRWGKKNGPPYPLKPGEHSASEKKAGWRKSLNGGSAYTSRRKAKRALNKQLRAEMVAQRHTNSANRNAARALHFLMNNATGKRAEEAAKLFDEALTELKQSNESYEKAKKKTLDLIVELDKHGYAYDLIKPGEVEDFGGYTYQRTKPKVKIRELAPDELGRVQAVYNTKTGKIEDPRSHREASYALSYADKVNEEKDWKKRDDVRKRLNQDSVNAMFADDYRKAAMLHVASHKIKDYEGKFMTPREASMLLKYRATSRELDLANFDRNPTGNKKADQETRDIVNNELNRIKHERKVAEEIDKLYGTSKEYGKETKYVKDINDYINRQTPYINEHLYGIKNKKVNSSRSASKTDRQATIDYNKRFTKFENLSEKDKRAFIVKDLNNDMNGLMSLAKKHGIPANKDQMHDVVTSSPSYARALKRSGMTYEEIAEKIGISESSVYNLLNS